MDKLVVLGRKEVEALKIAITTAEPKEFTDPQWDSLWEACEKILGHEEHEKLFNVEGKR